MSDHKILSSKVDYSCPWFDINREKIKYPNGIENEYFILNKTLGFVGVIGFQKDEIILIHQWRSTIKQWLYEIPMGGIDEGETPLQAAQREFVEETGYKAGNWKELGQFFVASGFTNQKGYFYLASDLENTHSPQNNPKEIIKIKKFKLTQIDKMIKQGEIEDGPTLAALNLFRLKV